MKSKKIKTKYILLVSLFICIHPINNISAQEVDIGIIKQYVKKLNIAISEFTPQGKSDQNLANKLQQALNSDLKLVDYFNPVTATTGSDLILRCSYALEGANLAIECKLYEGKKGQMLLGKKFSGTTDQYKKLIHSITDSIITTATGEKGIAQTKLTFEGTVNGLKQIFISDFDGGNFTQITKDACLNLLPTLSPDGNKILYTSYLYNLPQTFIYDLKSGIRNKICGYPGLNTSANFSPDGNKIALTLSKDGNPEIYTINIDGSGLTRITNDKSVDTAPCWSPDGKKIAFVSNRSGTPQIYIVDASGGTPKRFTYTNNYNTNPNWSPKGDLIVYNSLVGGSFQIYIIDVNGGDPIPIPVNAGSCENPSFAPDGRHIVFSLKEGYNYSLCLMDIFFREPHKLGTKGVNYTSPDWGR